MPREQVQAICDVAQMQECMEDCEDGCGVCGFKCDDQNTTVVELFAAWALETTRNPSTTHIRGLCGGTNAAQGQTSEESLWRSPRALRP